MTPEELAGEIRKALVSNKGDGRESYLAEDVAAWLLGRYLLAPLPIGGPHDGENIELRVQRVASHG